VRPAASSTWTLAQLEDALGGDPVLLCSIDFATQKPMTFTLSMLPPTAIPLVVAWLNARLGGQPPPVAV
jgi:hypothetical protein